MGMKCTVTYLIVGLLELAVRIPGSRSEDSFVCIDYTGLVWKPDFDMRACSGFKKSAEVGVYRSLCLVLRQIHMSELTS